MKLVAIWAEPPGGGGKWAPCTKERAAASRSLSPEERVIANELTAPDEPMVNETPTTPFAPRARAAGIFKNPLAWSDRPHC